MSAVGKFLKPIASMGASLIPGIGGGLSTLINSIGGGSGLGGLLGSIGGGIANSGNQGGMKYSGTTSRQGDTTYSGSTTNKGVSNINQLNETLENPADQSQRLGLNRILNQQINKAQQPVYGDAQKATVLNDLNSLAQSSMKSLQRSLGAAGQAGGGALGYGASQIEQDRYGKAADFFTKMPLMEREAQANLMNPLLQLGGQYAALAPRSQRTTGQQTTDSTQTTSGTQHNTETGTNQGEQLGQGAPMWKNILGGASEWLGDWAGGKANPAGGALGALAQYGPGVNQLPLGGISSNPIYRPGWGAPNPWGF